LEKLLETRRAPVIRDWVRGRWPALVTCGLVIVGAVVSAVLMAARTPGQFLYACDDFYINLGEARRLVDGTTYGEFPSTSTCVGWVLGMAGLVRLVGADVTLFLVGPMNVCAGLVATWTLFHCVRRDLPPWLTFLVLLLFAWAAGLIPMALIGMEHALHICFVVLFGAGLLRVMDGKGGAWLPVWILAGAFCRMETCFVAAAGALVLLVYRRYWLAAWVLAASALPVVAQGLWQLHQGHAFFANPILIKTALNRYGSPVKVYPDWMPADTVTVTVASCLLALILVAYSITSRAIGARRKPLLFFAFFVACAIAHQLLAANHWLGRYQAYLVGLGVMCLGVLLAAVSRELPYTVMRTPRAIPYGLIGLAVLMKGTAERGEVWLNLPRISWELQSQMFQNARLASSADAGEPVILNDVGCTLFYTDVPVVDITGLTSWDVAKMRRASEFGADQFESLATKKGAKMAVIYPDWFRREIPATWVLVGQWSTPLPFYASSARIGVYATAPQWKRVVEARWRQLAGGLPEDNGVR
jgi:hypothetical protein